MRRAGGIATLAALGLMALAVPAHAQPHPDRPTWSLYGGMSLATLDGKDVGDANYKAGFVAGVSTMWNLGGAWGFQPELQYVQKGYSSTSSSGGVTVKGEGRLSYFEVPLLLRVSAHKTRGAAPHFVIGPAIAFKSGCTLAAKSGSMSLSADCRDIGDVESLDFGAIVGIGADFQVGGQTFTLSARYDHGLRNLGKDKSGKETDAHNRTFTFLVGLSW